jgi:hypothetical protein
MTAQTAREAALQQLSAAIQPPTLAPVWTRYQAMLTPTPHRAKRARASGAMPTSGHTCSALANW